MPRIKKENRMVFNRKEKKEEDHVTKVAYAPPIEASSFKPKERTILEILIEQRDKKVKEMHRLELDVESLDVDICWLTRHPESERIFRSVMARKSTHEELAKL
jgi:hypothetical protein